MTSPFLATVALAALAAVTPALAQTVFTVNNLAPTPSTGAYVSITAPDFLHHNSGTVVNAITPVTFGTNSYFASPGPSFGASNPGFNFNGAISGTSIPAATVIPVSYNFSLSKNISVPGTVGWSLYFSDNLNATPFLISSGSLSTAGAATQTFSGTGSNYSFTTGGATSFTAAIQLTYTTGLAMTEPLVTIGMANTGFGGGGITLGASAIPEPSTYAAIAGAAMLGLAVWKRRRATTPSAAQAAVTAI